MQEVDIYIATSIKGPKRGWGAYLYILGTGPEPAGRREVGEIRQMEQATENGLALWAAREALSRINRPCRVILWLDCPYVAAALEKGWFRKWEGNGWRNARGRPVQDPWAWQDIAGYLEPLELEVRLRQRHPYTELLRWVAGMANKDNLQKCREFLPHSVSDSARRGFRTPPKTASKDIKME